MSKHMTIILLVRAECAVVLRGGGGGGGGKREDGSENSVYNLVR